jgi:hypothetical protein
MTDEHNEAELRLRAADPAGPSRPLPTSRIPRAELLETIMTTTTESPAPPAAPSRTKWLLAAAAVVVAAASATTIALATSSGGGSHHQVASVLHLKMPGAARPGPGATCIQLTVDLLRDKQLAFSGTAVDVTDTSVTLNVDHWYKGGNADQVELANLGGAGPTTEGAITFTAGQRYLVSASDGTVGICGYSGEYTPALAQLYDQAFGS